MWSVKRGTVQMDKEGNQISHVSRDVELRTALIENDSLLTEEYLCHFVNLSIIS